MAFERLLIPRLNVEARDAGATGMTDATDRRIAVIIPAYNAAAYVIEALESIVVPASMRVRAVVIDDGSTDDTAARVTEWSRSSALDVLLIAQANSGQSVARNSGILAVDEPFIAFLDADDVFLPGHLERLMGALDACPEALVAFDDAEQFDATGTVPITMLERAADVIATVNSTEVGDTGVRLLGDGLFQSLLAGNWIAPSTWLLRRRALAACGLFDAALLTGEDREFALRLALKGSFAWAPGVGVRKRVHDDNMTRTVTAELFDRYALLALASIRLRSTPEQQEAIDAALEATAQEFWYQASRRGRRHLAECALWVRSLGLRMRPAARDVARAAMRSTS